jgi:ribosomal protein L22
MADEKDIEEKKDDAPKEAAESKADAPEAKAKKAAEKPAAKKDAPKKAAAKKEPKEKPANPDNEKKSSPKADKPAKADKDEKPAREKKPRRARAKKAAKDEKPARRKPRAPEELPVVRASAKYVRIAPRKARLVADQVRGLHIEQARALLAFSPRDAARDIQKLIDSAAANAENNHDLVGDEMRITSITVDEGPTLRRFRPRALGRATPINKRTSHIAVALTPVEDD